ncbi:MAG: FkbM family methyltransferase [Xanthomonadales bacterium]|jgi:FkbM family methyltransferase|nr:FkbM family methyltransferase [Xanthomonadales bacterium]
MSIKQTIRRAINRLGYDIQPISTASELQKPISRTRTTLKEAYDHLREIGFRPKTVLDIGVATGTPELYSAFHDSYFLLVEPLDEFDSSISKILRDYHGSHVKAAAGPKPGQVTFNVHNDHLDGSSIYKESMGEAADGYELTVPMVRIDDVLEKEGLLGPYLIKVDVQGAELDALEGARDALLDAEVVTLEVSLFGFMKGAPQLHEVVAYMKSHGFVAYDIVLGWNRPLDNALGQVDIVFVKENGIFRSSHAFSTDEQRKILFGS